MATQKNMLFVIVSQEDTERSNYLYYIVDPNKVQDLMSEKNVKKSGAVTLAIYGNGNGKFHHIYDYDGSIDYYYDDLLHRVTSIKPITKEHVEVLRKFISISLLENKVLS